MATPHTHHLTPMALFALKFPGKWAWSVVLRLNLATHRCILGNNCPL